MFFDIARIIKEKKPHAFLLENVKKHEVFFPLLSLLYQKTKFLLYH
ncbi:DNA cytosine methyltransferase [Escherichia coli]